MKSNLLIACLVFVSAVTYGQKQKPSKVEKAIEKIIGSWKFDYAILTVPSYTGSTTTKQRSEIFHTDTIHFFADMKYQFKSHGGDDDIKTNTGEWDVIDNGKILIFKNRVAKPPFDEPLTEISIPIKKNNQNTLVLRYSVHVVGSSNEVELNNTPVYFNRIK